MANNESTDVIREKVDSFEYKPQISSFGHVLKVGRWAGRAAAQRAG